MVDQVVISQVGTGVPPWMTEVTAKKILKSLTLSNRSDLKLELLVKQLIKVTKEGQRQGGGSSSTNANTQASNQLTNSLRELDRELNRVETDVNRLGGSMRNTSEGMTRSSKALQATMGGAKAATGLLGEVMGMVTGALFSSYKTALDLNKQGLMINGSANGLGDVFGSFAGTARGLNLKFAELTEITGKYTAMINQFGMGNFRKTASSAISYLNQFGITNQEAAAMTADYLDTLNQLGTLDRKNSAEQQAVTKRQLIETTKWSFILGKSREQIEAQVKAAQQSASAQLYLAQATPKQAEAFRNAAKMIGPGAEQLLGAITQPVIQGTGVYTDMLKMGGTEAAKALENYANAVKSGADSDVQAKMLEDLRKTLPVDALSRLKNQFGVVDDATVHLLTALNQTTSQYKANEEANKAAGKTTEQRIKAEQGIARVGVVVKNTMTKWSEIFNRAFAQMLSGKTGEKLNKLVVDIANLVGRFADWATDKLASLLEKGLPFIVEITGKFIRWISEIPAWINKFKDEQGSIKWVDLLKDGVSKIYDAVAPAIVPIFEKLMNFIGEKIQDMLSNSAVGRLLVGETTEHKAKRERNDKLESEAKADMMKMPEWTKTQTYPGMYGTPSSKATVLDSSKDGYQAELKRRTNEKIRAADEAEAAKKANAEKSKVESKKPSPAVPIAFPQIAPASTPVKGIPASIAAPRAVVNTPASSSTSAPVNSKPSTPSPTTVTEAIATIDENDINDITKKVKSATQDGTKSVGINTLDTLKDCLEVLLSLNQEMTKSNRTLDAIQRIGDRE